MDKKNSLLQRSKNAAKKGTTDFFVRRPFLFAISWSLLSRLPGKKFFNAALPGFEQNAKFFENKIGLEIGGPSKIFSGGGNLPIYNRAERIDGCNFSERTVWEGSISRGLTYQYTSGKIGNQFICEGNQLDAIADGSYDFVVASHSIEHFANPLKAMKEWLRVLKPGGVLLVVAPDKRFTFDHRRQITLCEHVVADYAANMGEDDLTHLEEILSLHDRRMDRGSGSLSQFTERSRKNFENRCLHHHVFDETLLRQLFTYCGAKVIYSDFSLPFNIIMMGIK